MPTWTIVDGKKKCTKCLKVLPADYEHFRYRDQEKGWFQSECRACELERGLRARWKRNVALVGHPPSACYLCGTEISLADAHLDRIVPEARGGQYVTGNCGWLCEMCNRLKNGVTLEELRSWIDRILAHYWKNL